MIIILTGDDKDKFMGIFDNDREYQAIGRRLDGLKKDISALDNHIKELKAMVTATKEEVRNDIAEIKSIVAETRGMANSALVLLQQYIDKVNAASATAEDLGGFRAELKIIHDELNAEKDQLKAAIETNPQA